MSNRGAISFEGVCFAYERHLTSVCAVWWVRAAFCVSTSGERRGCRQRRERASIWPLPCTSSSEGPPGSSPPKSASYLVGICSFETLKKLFVNARTTKMMRNWVPCLVGQNTNTGTKMIINFVKNKNTVTFAFSCTFGMGAMELALHIDLAPKNKHTFSSL